MAIRNFILSNYVPIKWKALPSCRMSINRDLKLSLTAISLFSAKYVDQHRAFCVLRFSKCESLMTAQRDFSRRNGIYGPTTHVDSNQFGKLKCLCKEKSKGRPRVSDDTAERTMESFQRGPCKSTDRANR